MYRFKYEESQDKLIVALEEISFLKDLLAKKVGFQTKEDRLTLRVLSSLSCQLNSHPHIDEDFIL